ncbi:MAG: hypothetical protein IT225_07990 [Flavobacteriales bacterium]|nr:hypothetical protein [Flavobacteriales bacterium]
MLKSSGDGEMVRISGIMEHNLSRLSGNKQAGIHSGDSNAVLPPFDLSEKVIQQDLSRLSGIREHTHKIALALKTVGLGGTSQPSFGLREGL